MEDIPKRVGICHQTHWSASIKRSLWEMPSYAINVTSCQARTAENYMSGRHWGTLNTSLSLLYEPWVFYEHWVSVMTLSFVLCYVKMIPIQTRNTEVEAKCRFHQQPSCYQCTSLLKCYSVNFKADYPMLELSEQYLGCFHANVWISRSFGSIESPFCSLMEETYFQSQDQE